MQTPACPDEVGLPVSQSKRKYVNSLPVVRDVRERGRDIEGCIKQWFGFVKPNFEKVHFPMYVSF